MHTDPTDTSDRVIYALNKFCMGADLSYVNEIEDHGGIYRDSTHNKDPFDIFKSHGCNLVRVRLWNNPLWTREIYGVSGLRMYSDLADVEKTIRRAKAAGMGVNLDFHYSDTWADPSNQEIPLAWKTITTLEDLSDSVYNFTFRTLKYLNDKGLMPEMVQIGNEINCGLMMTNIPASFPLLNVCEGNWAGLGVVINEAIRAVREVSALSTIKTEVILHIAEPKYVEWWFDQAIHQANVTDFDVVGFSYYPLWHTDTPLANIGNAITRFKNKYQRKVMIVETAYPWTSSGEDNYPNLFGSQSPIEGYPFTENGQFDFMKALVQKVISSGGEGVMVWEPAWISSELKTPWGNGSSWENTTFFDFEGNTKKGIDFMTYPYQFPK
jgi:arabinogalactan endo-1,4-beta-galactosidase